MALIDIDHLRTWVGNTETLDDVATLRALRSMNSGPTAIRARGLPAAGAVAAPHVGRGPAAVACAGARG
jgi:hypothetical protein